MRLVLRPPFRTWLDRRPPKRAPRRERLAIQEPSCSVMVKWMEELGVREEDLAWREARAGEVYPLHRPTENGPNATPSTVRI